MKSLFIHVVFFIALAGARPALAKNHTRGWVLLGIGAGVMIGGIALLGIGLSGSSTLAFSQRQPLVVAGGIVGTAGAALVVGAGIGLGDPNSRSPPPWVTWPRWGRPQ